MTKKSFIFFTIFIFFAFLNFAFLCIEIQKAESEISLAQVSIPIKRKTEPITLLFVGDIMLDRGAELKIKKEGQEDWNFPFLKIQDYLKTADILFGNLEGPISDKGTKVGSIYSFRADPRATKGLSFAGFDLLSLANNHMFDYGVKALEDTFLRLKEVDIDYVGAGFNREEAYLPIIKEIKGGQIAFLAYTNLAPKNWEAGEDYSGLALLSEERLREDIKAVKKQADITVVSFHFGQEYQTKSNAEQQYFGHLAIDLGADLVVGHHPHVVQEIEQYEHGYIAYSLGNFVFDQDFSKETMQGLILKILIKDKKIKEVKALDIEINEHYQPFLLGQ